LPTLIFRKMSKNQQKIDSGWKLLDHTADIMIEVRGLSLKELFLNAAEAMTTVLVPCADVLGQTELDVALEADAAEELLVSWLREILFHVQTRGLILVRAEMDDLSDTALKAKLHFGASPPECEPEFEIKAVTYHGLSIQEQDGIYSARIVFDI
jgi:SHS2 domain-containing protein